MIRIPKNQRKQSDGAAEEMNESLRSQKLFSDRSEDSEASRSEADELSLPEKSNENPALSAAYRILQSGANSRKMLRDKLIRKGFSQSDAVKAVALCESQGLLHEKRLFMAHTEYLSRKKHYGKSRIYRELLQKFDRQSVDAFFAEAIEEIDFEANAKEEAERVAHRGKRYTVSRLSALGYTSHEIYEALDGLTFEDEIFTT